MGLKCEKLKKFIKKSLTHAISSKERLDSGLLSELDTNKNIPLFLFHPVRTANKHTRLAAYLTDIEGDKGLRSISNTESTFNKDIYYCNSIKIKRNKPNAFSCTMSFQLFIVSKSVFQRTRKYDPI